MKRAPLSRSSRRREAAGGHVEVESRSTFLVESKQQHSRKRFHAEHAFYYVTFLVPPLDAVTSQISARADLHCGRPSTAKCGIRRPSSHRLSYRGFRDADPRNHRWPRCRADPRRGRRRVMEERISRACADRPAGDVRRFFTRERQGAKSFVSAFDARQHPVVICCAAGDTRSEYHCVDTAWRRTRYRGHSVPGRTARLICRPPACGVAPTESA